MTNKNIPPEDLPLIESMGPYRQFGYDANAGHRDDKNWLKAKRFLQSRLGKPWDNIYSEICSYNPNKERADLFRFIKKNLHHLLEFNIIKDEDKILLKSNGEKFYARFRLTFYVEGGILRSLKSKSLKWTKAKKKFKEIGGKNYIKYEEIWYEFEYIGFSERKGSYSWSYSPYDCIYRRPISERDCWILYGKLIIAISKKQINSREIKKLGLNNENT